MDQNFLLESDTAKTLFHSYAADMPIIDYHCHVSPREIAENRRFENLTQLWLEGDHYKWRLMRWFGVDEELITGNAGEYEKFFAFASILPRAVGNPVYHWAHLELQRYFGCHTPLSAGTAGEIWNHCNEKLKSGISVREIIRQSRVEIICTTDDPIDSLEWHMKIAKDGFETAVLPSFRPDKALGIQSLDFLPYLEKLAAASGSEITDFASLCVALKSRLDHFEACGCRVSDHGFGAIPWAEDYSGAAEIFARKLAGGKISGSDTEIFQTTLLLFLSGEYFARGWIMQLHYGAQRNVDPVAFAARGVDTGYDCVATPEVSTKLTSLLGAMSFAGTLPKTALYSLNPSDNTMLSSVAGSFQKSGAAGWVQHGSAWWFNDSKPGMEQQLTNLASTGALGSFVGMLTDSRSFTSYPRHEYFRRILCNLIGKWVENGEYPPHIESLGALVQDISYGNIAGYLELK